MPRTLQVDPRTLLVPPSRPYADPARLQQQIAAYGHSTDGMPAILVDEDADGRLMIMNGVTRATRIAKLSPGQLVTVEVQTRYRRHRFPNGPTVADVLP